jgi:hypothetical protein
VSGLAFSDATAIIHGPHPRCGTVKVFISWSGERSKLVALELHQWFPDVIQAVVPYMSRKDIGAGVRWSGDIAAELDGSDFGVLCITPDNTEAPWILFEAGALSKRVATARVCPFLVGLDPSDLPEGPLTQFQAKRANREDTWDLVVAMNETLGPRALPVDRVQRTFDREWPTLEAVLAKSPPAPKVERRSEDMLAELLDIVRGMSRTLANTVTVTAEPAGTPVQFVEDSKTGRHAHMFYINGNFSTSEILRVELTMRRVLGVRLRSVEQVRASNANGTVALMVTTTAKAKLQPILEHLVMLGVPVTSVADEATEIFSLLGIAAESNPAETPSGGTQ